MAYPGYLRKKLQQRKKRLRLHSFGPTWTISIGNQWEISEVGRFSCFVDLLLDFTLFVIDIHQILLISFFPTPFDHSQIDQNNKMSNAIPLFNNAMHLDWILKSSDWSLRGSGQIIFCGNCAEFWQQPTMFLLLFLATGRKKTVFSFFWSTPLCYESHLWNISMNYDCHMVPFSTSLSTDRWSNWYSIQDEETFELSKSELK